MNAVAIASRITLKNILFATDLSECANRALPYVLSFARRYGAMMHAAYVVPSDSALMYMSPGDWAVVAEEDEKRMAGYISTLEKLCAGVPHQIMTPRGNVPDALATIDQATSDRSACVGHPRADWRTQSVPRIGRGRRLPARTMSCTDCWSACFERAAASRYVSAHSVRH